MLSGTDTSYLPKEIAQAINLELGAELLVQNSDPNSEIYAFDCDAVYDKMVQFTFNGTTFEINSAAFISIRSQEGFLDLCLSAFVGIDMTNLDFVFLMGQAIMRAWVVAYDMVLYLR
jgi:hypothetical protein